MKPLRVGIIGATGTALKRTIPALAQSQRLTVCAAQARDPTKLADLKSTYSIPHCFLSEQDLLASGLFDLLYIANPPFLHRASLTLATSTRKPIVCEKPLATNVEDLAAIETLLEHYPAPFMVAHHIRHQSAVIDIASALAAGRIGRPTSAWCQWAFRLNPAASNAKWKLDPGRGGGTPLLDAGIHALDLMIHFFGRPNRTLRHSFRMELPTIADNATILLCYKDLSVAINASQNTPALGNHLMIYGTKGKIEVFGAMNERSITEVNISTAEGTRTNQYAESNLYAAELENFADYLTGRSPSHGGTSLADALLATRIILRLD